MRRHLFFWSLFGLLSLGLLSPTADACGGRRHGGGRAYSYGGRGGGFLGRGFRGYNGGNWGGGYANSGWNGNHGVMGAYATSNPAFYGYPGYGNRTVSNWASPTGYNYNSAYQGWTNPGTWGGYNNGYLNNNGYYGAPGYGGYGGRGGGWSMPMIGGGYR